MIRRFPDEGFGMKDVTVTHIQIAPVPPGPVAGTILAARIPSRAPAIWEELHLRALTHEGQDDSAWLADFVSRIAGSCNCRREWVAEEATNPVDFNRFFAWTVERHNLVNYRLGKPECAENDARAYWSARLSAS